MDDAGTILPKPGILDIEPYVGGRAQIPGVEKPIKLSSNESALGPSPDAIAAYLAASSALSIYPEGSAKILREAIGQAYGLNPDRIVCGNGSDELLTLIGDAYLRPGDEVVFSQHAFLVYRIAALANSATPVEVPEPNLRVDVKAILAAITARTRLVYLANPNNPTGSYLTPAEIRMIHAGLPKTALLVIDAAYCEYVRRNDYEAGIELVSQFDNVVMTRTFSKIHGLAGLRIGWAFCPASVVDVLNRVRGPFNVSSAALAAGKAALDDTGFVALAREHNDYWRPWLADELAKLGIETVPSVANFVLARFPDKPGHDAAAADAHLRKHGIIVRAVKSYGLPDCLRITVGTGEENRALIAALAAFQEGR